MTGQLVMSRAARCAASVNILLLLWLSSRLWSRMVWKAYTDVSDESAACIIYPDDGGRRFLRNPGTYLQTRASFPIHQPVHRTMEAGGFSETLVHISRLERLFPYISRFTGSNARSWFHAMCVHTVIVIVCDWTSSIADVYIMRSARPLCVNQWTGLVQSV